MRGFLFFAALAGLIVAPLAARSASTAMSMGAGPHGYDWLVGTWSCTNSIESPIGGPKNSTFTAAQTDAGSILIRVTGKGFDQSAYLTYVPKTKTWWAPAAFSDGSIEVESSTQTGPKVIFPGTYYPATGAPMKTRDTFTRPAANKDTDLGEVQAGGAWKTLYNVACTKS